MWGRSTDFGFLQDGDLEVIGAPLDFLGVNYYFPSRVRAAEPARGRPGAAYGVDDLGIEDVIEPGRGA